MAKRRTSGIPTQEELFYPILAVAMRYPAGNFTAVWYNECKDFFPDLKPKDFQRTTGNNNENEWKIQIRFAKKKLEYDFKYMIANEPRGFWRVSNAGAKAYREMVAGTWTKPEIPEARKSTRQ